MSVPLRPRHSRVNPSQSESLKDRLCSRSERRTERREELRPRREDEERAGGEPVRCDRRLGEGERRGERRGDRARRGEFRRGDSAWRERRLGERLRRGDSSRWRRSLRPRSRLRLRPRQPLRLSPPSSLPEPDSSCPHCSGLVALFDDAPPSRQPPLSLRSSWPQRRRSDSDVPRRERGLPLLSMDAMCVRI